MATDIPTGGTMLTELLIGLVTQGISSILQAFHKKGAAAAVDAADQVALSVLRKTAEIKGLTIDWSDPSAVASYVSTLPVFVPIPEPSPIVQAPAQADPPPAKS